MPKIILGPYYGGIAEKKNSGSEVEFETLQHFNITTDYNVLSPNLSFETDEGEDKAKVITEFVYGSDGILYGRGTNGTKITIYEKSSLTGNTWTASTNGAPSTGTAITGCFAEYDSKLYGVRTGGVLWSYAPSTDTFTDTVGTLASSSFIGQGITGPDDNFYIPYDRRIAKYDGSTFTATSLLLPSYLVARCVENKGNYLAIACSGNGVTTNSTMFLWDQIKADPDERIDFGLEELQIIGNIGGVIVGVCLTENSSNAFEQFLVIKIWAGGEKAQTVKQIPLGSNGYFLLKNKFVVGDVLYFILNVNNDAEDLKGIWSVSQNEYGQWIVNQEYKMINNTIVSTLNGAYKVADYWFIAHSSDGSISHIDDSQTYTTTSTAVSTVFTDKNGSSQNEIVSVTLITDPLPASSTASVELKPDGGSWETAISSTTTSAVRKEAIKLTSGASFTKWTTLQVRLKSTNGAIIRKVIIDYNTTIASATRK